MSTHTHPELFTLAQARPGPRIREHLAGCPLCRIERRRLLAAAASAEPAVGLPDIERLVRSTVALAEEARAVLHVLPHRTGSMGVVADGEAQVLVEYIETDAPGDVEMRFLQLRQVVHPSLLGWTAIRRSARGFRVIGTAPPLGTRRPGPSADPHLIVHRCAQVIGAVAHLHRAGLSHGRLADAWLGTSPTGRAVLIPAALVEPGDLASDRRDLGRLLEGWLEEVALPPLHGLAVDLVQGRVASTESLLARLLAVLDATRSGALRYRRGAPLGRGGMGEVHRAEDPALGRQVALKTLRPEARMSAERFVAEARLTASLQHPGVIPVHEVGELPDGRPYYAMQVVEGQTLTEAFLALHAASTPQAWQATPDGTTLRRLVEVFARIGDAVGYAHSRGIVHRDLKPDNIALGAHGVVTVLDWGLAATEASLRERREIVGTPWFMAPEQRQGLGVDRRADVYALGRILQALLTGGPRPSEAPPPAPTGLMELMRRCTSASRESRPADASEVAAAARAWLDGLQRKTLADAACAEAAPLADHADARDRQAGRLRQQAAELLAQVPRHAPVQDKLPAWRMEERADALEAEAAVLRTRCEQGLQAALYHDAGHRLALDSLAAMYKERLLVAEARLSRAETARLSTLLEAHDGGHHRAWLHAEGRLTLVTEPPGARVIVERYVEEDRQLVARPQHELGPTPLVAVPLPHGSYRLRIRHPACDEVLYPVQIGRGEHWDGVPPGASEPLAVPLPARGTLDRDVVYVPPGWVRIGGDARAVDGLPGRRLWVDGFVIGRVPVTLGRFLSILDTLVAAGRVDEARRLAPMDLGRWMVGDKAKLEQDASGRFRPAAVDGVDPWSGEHPVVLLQRAAIDAYLASLGPGWRLPHELEWEKAARGVDGRAFPWGHRTDPSLCNVDTSHRGGSRVVAVQAFPSDVSPYGVLGLGGNMRDRCANGYLRALPDAPRLADWGEEHEDGSWETSRGGGWMSVPAWSRCAGRFAGVRGQPSSTVGFRVVRTAVFRR